jgi:hypothetical protein
LAGPLWRISPRQLLTLPTPGLPTWSRHPAWISVSLRRSKGLVHGSAASFSCLEGDLRITLGCTLTSSRDPHRLQIQGAGTHYPNRAGWSDIAGASRNVVARMLDQQEQDSNLGGWRKERFITQVCQNPGSFQIWHQPCSSRLWGFYASECGSKQVGRTKTDVAVSLSLGGYNISY